MNGEKMQNHIKYLCYSLSGIRDESNDSFNQLKEFAKTFEQEIYPSPGILQDTAIHYGKAYDKFMNYKFYVQHLIAVLDEPKYKEMYEEITGMKF